MIFPLDTNICIYPIKNRPPGTLRGFENRAVGDIGVSGVTAAELYFGAERSYADEGAWKYDRPPFRGQDVNGYPDPLDLHEKFVEAEPRADEKTAELGVACAGPVPYPTFAPS